MYPTLPDFGTPAIVEGFAVRTDGLALAVAFGVAEGVVEGVASVFGVALGVETIAGSLLVPVAATKNVRFAVCVTPLSST